MRQVFLKEETEKRLRNLFALLIALAVSNQPKAQSAGASLPLRAIFTSAENTLLTNGFKPNFIPGFCPYKFLYVWLDLKFEQGSKVSNLGWLYWFDYDGKKAFDAFKQDTPKTSAEKSAFGKQHAERMFEGIDVLRNYVDKVKIGNLESTNL